MILVTGRGNGGTRLPIRILRGAGVIGDKSGSMGGVHDTWALMLFAAKWLREYMLHGECSDMVADWNSMLRGELGADDVAKETRIVLYLPFADKYTPDLRIIHIVRDVRDHMVREGNERPVDNEGSNVFAWLTDRQTQHMGRLETIAWEWSRRHTGAHEYGIHRMGERYMMVRLEDIVKEPVKYAAKILAFANVDADPEPLVCWIDNRKSIGRWRKHAAEFDGEAWARAVNIAYPALVRFGYLP